MKMLLLILVAHCMIFAQPKWQRGVGTAVGSDIEAIRSKALENARLDALSKAGIMVSAGDTRVVSESGNELTDFYARFAESSTRGIILEERVIHEGELQKIDGTTYKMEIEIDANVAVQQGEPDPSFTVSLNSSRQIVKEGEPFVLTVTSTKAGYLTIFNVYRDSISVVFPNAVDKKNSIEGNRTFVFPPNKAYDLTLTLPRGRSTSSEMFIAVVTEDDVAFPNLDDLKFNNDALQLKSSQLNLYSKWLYEIPLQKRASDEIPMTVQ